MGILKWVFYLAASAIALVGLLATVMFLASAGLVIGGIAVIALAVWLVAAFIKSCVEAPR